MAEESIVTESKERPLIAVSRCLLGEAVRYDGGERRLAWITEVLSVHCDLMRLCPEVGAGLAVPRPAVRLVVEGGVLHALGVDDPELDVTASILAYSSDKAKQLAQVDGLILKAGSPSCGLTDTSRFDLAGRRIGQGAGLFSQVVSAAWPELPVTDEAALAASEVARVAFLMRVFRYRCRRHAQVASQPPAAGTS